MSSKSKKGKKQPRKNKPAGASAGGAGTTAAAAAPPKAEHDPLEDLIDAPPGRSRLMQAFLIVLLIFLLIIFIVPFAIQSAFVRNEELPALTWNHPAEGTVELSPREFILEKRRFEFLLGGNDIEDVDVAGTVIYDAVAQHAGIEIADNELVSEIDQIVTRSFGGQRDLYRQFMTERHPGGVPGFENTIRRFLRSRRFGSLLSQLTALPDPERLEELWSERHVEYAFDYVELPVVDVEEDARGELPDDAALEAWFGELQEWERSRYNDPERIAAELVYYPVGTTPPAALLERYPEDEAADPDARAEEYYNRIFFTRFARPPVEETEEEAAEPASEDAASEEVAEADAAEGEEAAEDEPVEPEEPPSPYLSLDEAKDVALVEAPIYFAMQKWWEEMAQRETDGEEIDLAAEASALGLAFLGQDDALDYTAWSELEAVGGARLASAVRRTQPGERIVGVTAEAGALIVGRVTEKLEAELPPFADLRDRVADAWVEERSADLAVEKLAAVRVALVGEPEPEEDAEETPEDAADDTADESADEESAEDVPTVTEEEFRTAVETAGFDVQRRDWLDRAGPLSDDPDASEDAHVYVRGQQALYDLEEGELSDAALDGRRQHAYLVRLVGEREVDLARMKPMDLSRSRRQSISEAQSDFVTALYSEEELSRVYDLRWPRASELEELEGGDAEELPEE